MLFLFIIGKFFIYLFFKMKLNNNDDIDWLDFVVFWFCFVILSEFVS